MLEATQLRVGAGIPIHKNPEFLKKESLKNGAPQASATRPPLHLPFPGPLTPKTCCPSTSTCNC